MQVENFDQFHEYERRQHSIGDIPLGVRGLPVRGLAYFGVLFVVNAFVLNWLGLGAALLQTGMSGIVLLLVAYVGVPGAIAFVAVQQLPGGLPAHQLIAPALLYLMSDKDLFGWTTVRTVGSRWAPPDLVVEPNISDPVTPRMRLVGPADVLVGNSYERVKAPKRLLARGDEPAETILVGPSSRGNGPRGLSIPDGVAIEIRGVDR